MKLSLSALFTLVSLALSAQTSELVFPVDLIALGSTGTGTNSVGWVATDLSNYAAGNKHALRFDSNSSRADSPIYPAAIVAIDLAAFSSASNNLTRQLVVIPHSRRSADSSTNLLYRCAATATTSHPIAQTIVWDPALDIRSFSLAVECKPSARTNWGIARLAVHTKKPPGFTLCVR